MFHGPVLRLVQGCNVSRTQSLQATAGPEGIPPCDPGRAQPGPLKLLACSEGGLSGSCAIARRSVGSYENLTIQMFESGAVSLLGVGRRAVSHFKCSPSGFDSAMDPRAGTPAPLHPIRNDAVLFT